MSVYLDASLLVSFFTQDAFSERADRFMRAKPELPAVSDFAAAEFASAVARKVRMQRMSADEAREVLQVFDVFVARVATVVETTPPDISRASALVRRFELNLRAPDAINLAIAARLTANLATFDKNMAANAASLGLALASL